MSEEKKENSCCTTSGCGCAGKWIMVLVLGALIFAAGVLFAKTCLTHGGNFCPFSGPQVK